MEPPLNFLSQSPAELPALTSNNSSRTVSGSSDISSASYDRYSHSMSTLSDAYPLTSPSFASISLSSIDTTSPKSRPPLHEPSLAQSPAVSQLVALFQQPARNEVPATATHKDSSQSPTPLRRKNSSRVLRKRQSKVQLNPQQRNKRAFHQSNLDLLDHQKLTTFPQVYNTFVNLHGQVELSSDPSPGPTPRTHAPSLSRDGIVFVEDYFEAQTAHSASNSFHSTGSNGSHHRVVKSSSSGASLSPFSTMRRGSLVKSCVHCKKPLYEFTNTSFSELVCKDCAVVQQNSPTKSPSQHHHHQSRFKNMSTATLPIMRSDNNGWYTTVRRKLRWRWRLKGLLPPSVAS